MVLAAMAVRKVSLPGGVGLWAALFEIFYRISPDDQAEFTHKLISGENLQPGDPILVLRNHLLSYKAEWATSSRRDRERLAAAVVKSWSAWRAHQTINNWTALRWHNDNRRGETFPVPQ
jgi:hypothetical protein